jgi:hypothetical protein
MSLYAATVPQMKKMLGNLDRWLDAAIKYAGERKFEPNTLMQARLFPDQYPLVRQLQSACDAAKFAGARVAAKEAPKHPDTETTLEEIRPRIKAVIAFLDTIKESDFAGADKRVVPLTFMEGKGLTATDYVNELQIPNFYFHINMAYAILRHNGVPLGKTDYIGSLDIRDL